MVSKKLNAPPCREALSLREDERIELHSIGSLSISGFRGRQVPNTFFRQDGETNHIAIVFPGLGYRCYGPLLYYPTQLLLSLGADVLWAEYAYDREPEYPKLQPNQRREWRTSDCTAAMEAALGQRRYRRTTLVGKSIGTLAMGHLLTADSRLGSARAVWLTPLLKSDLLRSQLEKIHNPSLFISGSADSEYDDAFALRLHERPAAKFLVLEGAGSQPRDSKRCASFPGILEKNDRINFRFLERVKGLGREISFLVWSPRSGSDGL